MSRGRSARQFSIDLRNFGRMSNKTAEMVFRKIALELDHAVVMKTPVDTGRARANWYPSLGAPSSEVNPERFDPTGAEALAAITATVSRADLGSVIWLTNNLPYVLDLENGSSRQAPQGMVDVSLAAAAARYGGSRR